VRHCQANPFAAMAGVELGFSMEHLTYDNSPWNLEMMGRVAPPQSVWNGRAVANSGVVLGSRERVLSYLQKMVDGIRSKARAMSSFTDGGWDQGVHATIVYSGAVREWTDLKAHVLVGFGANLRGEGWYHLNEHGLIQQRDSAAHFAILHQWDRLCERNHFYALYSLPGRSKRIPWHLRGKSCYQQPWTNWVFYRTPRAEWIDFRNGTIHGRKDAADT
jgi:hypothetical protein